MNANTNNFYETDYGLWLANQINSLKNHRWDELDIENLIEELEGLEQSNKRELDNYLVVILAHLLKWEYQPQGRSGNWKGSIFHGRKRIARLFKDEHSLMPYVSETLQVAYADSVEIAILETNLPADVFPVECPYSVNQILSLEFLPGDTEDIFS